MISYIVDSISIGRMTDAAKSLTESFQFKSILNVGIVDAERPNSGVFKNIPEFIHYENIPLHDEEEISFKKLDSLADKVKELEKPLLVNCVGGLNRSVAVVCAYLMKHKKMSLRKALQLIAEKRFIELRLPIMESLEKFEKQIARNK